MKNKRKKKPENFLSQSVVRLWETIPKEKSDPLGSYTGRPEKTEPPEQDADDL